MQLESCDTLIDEALEKLHGGDPAAAEAMFRQVIEAQPNHAEARRLLGISLFQQDKKSEAAEELRRAVDLDPSDADSHYNFAEVLAALGENDAAQQGFLRCHVEDPSHPTALRRLAELRSRAGDHKGAADAGEKALKQTPDDVEMIFWVAQQMIMASRYEESAELLARATLLAPDNLKIHALQFNAAVSRNDVDGAIECVERAAALRPDEKQVLLARFLLYNRLCRWKEAADAGSEYVKRFPEDPAGHYALGNAFEQQGERGGAALAFARFIELKPDRAIGYARLGLVLLHVGHLKDAEVQLRKAIELDPKFLAAYLHLSLVLERIPSRIPEAIEWAQKALEIDPNNTDVLSWLAAIQTKQGMHSQAAETYRKTLEIDAKNVAGLLGYANLLAGQGQIETAWSNFAKVWEIVPDKSNVRSTALFFGNAHPELSQNELFALHQQWATLMHRETPKVFDNWDNDRSPERKLRIGYLSPDLRGHSVAYFLNPILAAHDKSAFEVLVYDNTPTSDSMSIHLHSLVERWYRVVGGSAERIADMVREHEVDILVDLAGHTSDNRLDVFARHPAPVQVSYIGYPNTTGLPEIEYRFTDELADPIGSDTYYSEELIRLDGGFLCFNPPPPWPDIGPSPAGESGPITFAAFNAVHKINGKVVAAWSSVLHALPDSKLLLKANGLSDPETRAALLKRFAEQDIEESRLIFVERTLLYPDHLQVYNRCDIALDTFPYNGTTTTCESLWMGVPVVTLAGDRHSARVSMSILNRLDLGDLVAKTQQEYVSIATRLAGDRKRLLELRATMRPRMSQSRLMDTNAHARAVESAYRDIWRRWCEKNPKQP